MSTYAHKSPCWRHSCRRRAKRPCWRPGREGGKNSAQLTGAAATKKRAHVEEQRPHPRRRARDRSGRDTHVRIGRAPQHPSHGRRARGMARQATSSAAPSATPAGRREGGEREDGLGLWVIGRFNDWELASRKNSERESSAETTGAARALDAEEWRPCGTSSTRLAARQDKLSNAGKTR